MLNQFNTSLWGDEAFSAILSQKSVSGIITTIIRDTSPPLYNLSEHFWFQIFGTSEVAIRVLSFIYFLIAVFFVYKIGEYLFGKKTGVVAAILTFLNPFLFIYGFEGRMYSLLLTTVTASMYFFIRKNWIFYVLATTLALYTHHFAIFAVFVQGVWFFKTLAEKKWVLAKSMFKAFLAIGILYAPWLIPLYNQTKMVGGGFWLGKPTVRDFGLLIIKYLNITFVLLILRAWRKNFGKSVVLVLWFLLPILTVWLLSQKFQSIFFDRYLLYTIPAAMLLAASEMTRISKIVFWAGVVILLYTNVFYFTHPTKRPFRDLANFVKESRKGDDYLINWNAAAHHLWEAKYYGIPAPLYIPGGQKLPFFVGTALMTKDDVINTVPTKIDGKKVNRVGVITSGSIDEVALAGYTKEEVQPFGDLKFIWLGKVR